MRMMLAAVAVSLFAAPAFAADPVPDAAAPTPAAAPVVAVVAPVKPDGATGQCKDGTYSHSKTHSGSCAGHKGVEKFLT